MSGGPSSPPTARHAQLLALAGELGAMPVSSAISLTRAFSHFLNLANVAEQHHRIRRRRAYQRDPESPPQRGSCDETFARLIASGVTRDRLYEAVCGMRIELVLTSPARGGIGPAATRGQPINRSGS